ncbi:hypothetical protein Neosp_012912 [[Neocosmospora] mangrovei]
MKAIDQGTTVAEYGEAVVPSPKAHGNLSMSDVPGIQWGRRARQLVRCLTCSPSTKNLMAMVLYAEYGLRVGDNAFVYMLVGSCTRMSRLLRLDTEDPQGDSSPLSSQRLTKRESIRRLMWSCYILDSFVGAGVDGNLSWAANVPPLPLACAEKDFIYQEKSRPVYAEVDKWVPLLSTTSLGGNISWYEKLPDFLAFNDLNLYIHKEQGTLGPYFFLHLAYHACVFDLTRVTLPGYSFPLSAAFFQVPQDFALKYRYEAWYHACCVSKVLETGLECGTGTLDDHFTSTAAFESTKIQVIYLTTTANGSPRLYSEGMANINTNLRVLTETHPYPDMPNVYVSYLCRLSAIIPFLHRFGFSDIATYWHPFQNTVLLAPSQSAEDNSEVVGPVETAFLNQIATFRLARREITEEGRRTGTCTPWSFSSAPPSPRPEQPRLGEAPGPPSQPFDESGLHMLALAGQSQSEAVASQLIPIMMSGPVSSAGAMQGGLLDQEQYFRMAEEISDYMTWDIALASQFDISMEDFFSTPRQME